MLREIVLSIILLPAAAESVAIGISQQERQSRHAVTVADAITMTQIGDQSYLNVFTRTGNVGYFSPDRSRFAFVTRKGNLQNDTVEYSLLVFRSDEFFTSPRAELVATLASSSNREAITQLAWMPDNDGLTFIGENSGEEPQLYRVRCRTRKLEKLTNSTTAVTSYSFSPKGDAFVYQAESVSQPLLISPEMRHRGFIVTLKRLDALYEAMPRPEARIGQMFYKAATMKTARPIGEPRYFAPRELPPYYPKISPDGRFALVMAFVPSLPKDWEDYTISPADVNCSGASVYACAAEYRLIDLEHGNERPLMNAPIVRWSEQAAWTRDGSLLLVNTLLPLDTADPAKRLRRKKNVYAVEIMPSSGRIVEISERTTPFQANMIQADPEQSRFTVQPNNAIYGRPTVFHKQGGIWKVSEEPVSGMEQDQPLSVDLEQDINTPPKLVASDSRTGKKAVVLDLNPQFAGLTFGHVEMFRWKTRDGRAAEGSLYYPPGYAPGKRYPLIIQTHGHSRERFWIDGPDTTAFAAQPLANRGFLVLQMGLGDRYDKASLDEVAALLGTANEGPVSVEYFESAIDELDRRGLVDPQRVGLSGFSRTVYHVMYMLTHSEHPIAAAVVADGVHFSYANCVFYLSLEGNSSLCEKENGGGPPYGRTLTGWEKTPAFNLDKVQAPILLQAISAPLGEWEILAGLQWLHKPVEMLNFYPEGSHILFRPQQRLLSQGSVVDWYCFWLNGEEDPNPAKAEQYKRWRELRKLQERANAPRANSPNK